jgi:hypothetical protein
MNTILSTATEKSINFAYAEANGLSKCFEAYADYATAENIFEIGFNQNSGYVYICLEDINISICSMLGQDVEYLVTNFETGKEYFFESFTEAQTFANGLN